MLIEDIKRNLMNEPLFIEYFSRYEELRGNIHREQDGGGVVEILEIKGNTTKEDFTRFKMLRLYKNQSNQIIITNIYLPDNMRKKGFGMKILSIIYELSKSHGCGLFIDDMVPSFYRKMLKKGAVEMNYEAVQIIDSTELFLTRE